MSKRVSLNHPYRFNTITTRSANIKGGGQIEVFKILNDYENIDSNIF